MNDSHSERTPATAPVVDAGVVLATLFEWLKQQQERHHADAKRDRFWRNLRTGILALGLLSGPLIVSLLGSSRTPTWVSGPYAALVRVKGVIGADNAASAERISNALEQAFADSKARGVVLAIDSPGGSPVQSSLIHDRLVSLRKAYPQKKVWAIGEDMLTSGAYFVAVGAPSICVNRSTLTGSIGVIREGWGFNKAIERLGVERRVFTAGGSKNRLDSFKPMSTDDEHKVQELLTAVHEHFKSVVRAGRDKRLKGDEAQLFSGDFWTGDEALQLGLVDRLCNLNELLQDEFGVKNAKDYTPPPSLMTSLASLMVTEARTQFGASAYAGPMLLPP